MHTNQNVSGSSSDHNDNDEYQSPRKKRKLDESNASDNSKYSEAEYSSHDSEKSLNIDDNDDIDEIVRGTFNLTIGQYTPAYGMHSENNTQPNTNALSNTNQESQDQQENEKFSFKDIMICKDIYGSFSIEKILVLASKDKKLATRLVKSKLLNEEHVRLLGQHDLEIANYIINKSVTSKNSLVCKSLEFKRYFARYHQCFITDLFYMAITYLNNQDENPLTLDETMLCQDIILNVIELDRKMATMALSLKNAHLIFTGRTIAKIACSDFSLLMNILENKKLRRRMNSDDMALLGMQYTAIGDYIIDPVKTKAINKHVELMSFLDAIFDDINLEKTRNSLYYKQQQQSDALMLIKQQQLNGLFPLKSHYVYHQTIKTLLSINDTYQYIKPIIEFIQKEFNIVENLNDQPNQGANPNQPPGAPKKNRFKPLGCSIS